MSEVCLFIPGLGYRGSMIETPAESESTEVPLIIDRVSVHSPHVAEGAKEMDEYSALV